ncbi:glycerate kinase [Thermodesulfobium narugense DSM 14796]|uniref:Glycerate kinase n=1 Tax=Thermodesulfobium narugense DSM 14796 TaxID=747365 RepID=M1E647_9BACT|nr:glycerate kinase [Thermodesulfobium narugense]AEE13993.1 glycerate kinase [Thermodesulfobium narugense DSM 14796]
MNKIVIAPDSYKGCLSALEVSKAIESAFLEFYPKINIAKVPIADGGEGTVDALVTATNGKFMYSEVLDPLGQKIVAKWGILGDGSTAVIEMASASGLPLVPKEKRNPYITSTFGTGQLILSALDANCKKIVIGIGGSATNDGGAGMAKALGVKFYDTFGNELEEGGYALQKLAKIDISKIDPRIKNTEILVACDVDNPLCGPRGASAVYGPQKGATFDMVKELDVALSNFAKVAQEATGKDVRDIPGSGAAGGLGAGLILFTGASLIPGVKLVLEITNFDNIVKDADLVITGEGNTDFQTVFGKAPIGVAKAAKKYNIPVVCISGGLSEGYESVYESGIDAIISISTGPLSLEECMLNGSNLLKSATKRLIRTLNVGMLIEKRSGQTKHF